MNFDLILGESGERVAYFVFQSKKKLPQLIIGQGQMMFRIKASSFNSDSNIIEKFQKIVSASRKTSLKLLSLISKLKRASRHTLGGHETNLY